MKTFSNNSYRFLVFLGVAVICFTSGCAKYENGPKFSLLTRKKRISHIWVLENAYRTLTQEKINYEDLVTWSFANDGTFSRPDHTSGSWEFIGDVELQLTFDTENTDSIFRFTITRLANKQLWLIPDYPSDTAEFHYKRLEK